MSARPPAPDDRAMARAAERASVRYDRHAALAAAAREELLGRLEWLAIEPRVVLDLGAGTGHAARALKARWRGATVVALDRSAGMLREAKRQRGWRTRFGRVRADARRLPFADGGVDLVVANLLLPFVADLDGLFAEVRRVLAPRGYFTFSTLGPGTLGELAEAAEAAGGVRHARPFHDLQAVGDALVRAGFADPVIDVDRYTLTYADLAALHRDLKGLGAAPPATSAGLGLRGRGFGTRLAAAYARYRQADGRLPASCEVVYGQAWRPGDSAPIRERRREVVVPLTALRRR